MTGACWKWTNTCILLPHRHWSKAVTVTAPEGHTEWNAIPVQTTDFSGEERDEGVVGKPVRVQIPPSAPFEL